MSKKGSWIKSGVVGVVVGAIAGVLFAPKSGKETRADIAEGALKVRAEAEKQLKVAYNGLSDTQKQAKVHAKDLTGKAKIEFEELQAKAVEAQEKVKKMIASVREGDDVTEEAVKDAIDKAEKVTKDVQAKVKK